MGVDRLNDTTTTFRFSVLRIDRDDWTDSDSDLDSDSKFLSYSLLFDFDIFYGRSFSLQLRIASRELVTRENRDDVNSRTFMKSRIKKTELKIFLWES